MASDATLALIVNDSPATAGTVATKWFGGRGTFMVEASSWGVSGSVKLQFKTPNGTFLDVGAAATLTANGMIDFELPIGEVKAVADGATGVYAYALGTRVN